MSLSSADKETFALLLRPVRNVLITEDDGDVTFLTVLKDGTELDVGVPGPITPTLLGTVKLALLRSICEAAYAPA